MLLQPSGLEMLEMEMFRDMEVVAIESREVRMSKVGLRNAAGYRI
jgi:hypothetical protein